MATHRVPFPQPVELSSANRGKIDSMSISAVASPTPRARRFFRKDNPPGYSLNDRKIALMRALARNRFLTTDQLAEIDGGSRQKVQRILRTLFDHELVHRSRAIGPLLDEGENLPLIYALAHAGARVLAQLDRTSMRDYNWTTKTKRRKAEHILHAIDTADAMRAFTKSIHDRGWGLLDHRELIPTFPEETRIASKGKSPFSLRVKIRVQGEDEPRRISVNPDRLFSPRPPGSRYNFAVELDEGSMPVFRWRNKKQQLLNFDETSVVRKLVVYHSAWEQDLHVTRWGFHQFRVLFVTHAQERIPEMLDAVRFVTKGKGSRLFVFTDFATLLANDPLGPIWIDGKCDPTDLLT
jgi:hypothetical protein